MAGVDELAHIVQLAGLIGILLGAGFCLVAGDRPLSSATLFYLLATIGSLVAQASPAIRPYGVMTIDVAYLAILMAIAMRWRRQWTLWAAAAQSLSVITHVAYLAESVPPAQYLTLLALWSYLVMVALCVGAGMAWQRRRSLRFTGAMHADRHDATERVEPAKDVIDGIPADMQP